MSCKKKEVIYLKSERMIEDGEGERREEKGLTGRHREEEKSIKSAHS